MKSIKEIEIIFDRVINEVCIHDNSEFITFKGTLKKKLTQALEEMKRVGAKK